ncbi:DUF6602 domain-containing protein [Flavobacterium beibuense]|uniref:DUF6602 domain-containing protein n=1 Tax=Flavobacterium beibuense TaxID=657326 RepID=UPI003A957818
MDKKDREFRKISIDTFFDFEASGLDIAQSQVKLIHNTGNITASGGHFEIAVRNFFRSKLPEKYYISNGHIIDTALSASPQLDMIIADNFRTPILYKTFDNTEYLTYESVFAYAEIKSSWNKRYIDDFTVTKERMHSFLTRPEISPNYIEAGGKGIFIDKPTTTNTLKNPLFTFMFIGTSTTFTFEDITEQYRSKDWKFLPNILCLFDRGIIVNINKTALDKKIFKINLYPEFITEKSENEWILLHFDKKRSTLGTLYYILLEHLNTSVLGYPNMLNYMEKIFDINPNNIDFISDY